MERYAKIPCQVEVASEFRYRDSVVEENTLFVTISQSGETADTLAALRHARQSGYVCTLVICNVPESSIVREADLTLMTRAGLEIGVASTKAFTTQLAALQLLVLKLAELSGRVAPDELSACIRELATAPARLETALALDARIEELAEHFVEKHHALFLGRGLGEDRGAQGQQQTTGGCNGQTHGLERPPGNTLCASIPTKRVTLGIQRRTPGRCDWPPRRRRRRRSAAASDRSSRRGPPRQQHSGT